MVRKQLLGAFGRKSRVALASAVIAGMGTTVQANEAEACTWTCLTSFGLFYYHNDHWHVYDGCMDLGNGTVLCFY